MFFTFFIIAIGIPDLSPMVLGTLENMHIVWSTNQPDVVNIYNIFADAGEYLYIYDIYFFITFILNYDTALFMASLSINAHKIVHIINEFFDELELV